MEVSCETQTSAQEIEFKRALIENVLPDVLHLLEMHHDETGTIEEFDPDFSRYLALEEAALTRLFIVEHLNEIVGYNVFFVMPQLHYRKTLWAGQDILFLRKEYRGDISKRFIQWCDAQLIDEGVGIISRAVHVKNDYSGLLKHLGYEQYETGFMRRA